MKYIDSRIESPNDDMLLLTNYCKFGALSEHIRNELKESEILHIFCDVCRGVAELHSNGITHFDLKLENILVDEDNKLPESNKYLNPSQNFLAFSYVICDFGSCSKLIYNGRSNSSGEELTNIYNQIFK